MIRVVSEGPVQTKEVVCPKCGYKLEYTGEDVKSHRTTDYSGDSDTFYYIVCIRPTCGFKIPVDSAWACRFT